MRNSDYSLKERMQVGASQYIVLVDVAGRKDVSIDDSNKNIYCIDGDGQIIWQVDAPQPKFERDSFVSLSRDGEVIKASRFFGSEFTIDIASGKAMMIGWHK